MSETPPKIWSLLSKNLKGHARNWFINRAEKKGIKWNSYKNANMQLNVTSKLENIMKIKNNLTISYPEYYLQPFHGYDEGNMEWLPSYECEAATLSISSTYWDNITVDDAEKQFRFNISKNIENYLNQEQIEQPNNILDIGCSIGISTEYTKKYFTNATNIVGVDLSPYFISMAEYRAQILNNNIKYIHANAENIPLENNTFDLILCTFIFHEVPLIPTDKIIQEAIRLLKKDGVLAIIDLDPEKLIDTLTINKFRRWSFEVTEPHIYQYYLNNMTQSLVTNGFINVTKFKNDPINSIWIGRK